MGPTGYRAGGQRRGATHAHAAKPGAQTDDALAALALNIEEFIVPELPQYCSHCHEVPRVRVISIRPLANGQYAKQVWCADNHPCFKAYERAQFG